jgi:hypothetical protein
MSKLNKRDRTATPSSSNAAKTTTATDTSRELLKAHTKSIEAISGDRTVTSRFSETIWRNQRRDETRLARWRGRMANFASIRLIDKGGGGRATVKSPRFRFQLGYLARVGRNNLKDHHMVSLPRPRYLAAYRSTPMGPVRASNRMEIRVKSAGGCRSHLGWKLIRENAISIRPRPQIQLRQYLRWPPDPLTAAFGTSRPHLFTNKSLLPRENFQICTRIDSNTGSGEIALTNIGNVAGALANPKGIQIKARTVDKWLIRSFKRDTFRMGLGRFDESSNILERCGFIRWLEWRNGNDQKDGAKRDIKRIGWMNTK